MRTLTLLCCLVLATPIHGANPKNPSAIPTPSLSIKVETPQPRLRSVSPQEVQAAYDRLKKGKDPAASQPAVSMPFASPAVSPEVLATPMPEENPLLPVPEHHLERVAPEELLFPKWEGKLQERKLPSHGQSGAEVVIENQWQGLIVSLEFRPETAEASQIIRFLMAEKGIEAIDAVPDVPYTIIIKGRHPGDLVWIPLYELKSRSFKPGYSYNLTLPKEIAAELLKSVNVAMDKKKQATAAPTPVQFSFQPGSN